MIPSARHAHEAIAFEDDVTHDLRQKIGETVRSESFDCPRPQPAAMRVMRMSHDPNVSLKQLAQVISEDPFLAGQVLQIANSPAFMGGTKIDTIAQGVVRLGLKGTRDIVMAAAMQGKVFQLPGCKELMVELWRHAVGCARLAELLCRVLRLPREHAFLAGLMHDVGKPVVLHVLADLSRRQKQPELLQPDICGHYLQSFHVEVGRLIAARWGLPDYVVNVIVGHHVWNTAKDDRQLVLVTAVANEMLHHFTDRADTSLELYREWDALGLSNADGNRIVEKMREVVERPDFYPM